MSPGPFYTSAPASLRDPPEWFVRELHVIDPTLAVMWSERQERWRIMRLRVPNSEVPSGLTRRDPTERTWWKYVSVYRVEAPDGSYRDLDRRTLDDLRRADQVNVETSDALAKLKALEKKKARDDTMAMAPERAEMAKYLGRVGRGSVSSVPTYAEQEYHRYSYQTSADKAAGGSSEPASMEPQTEGANASPVQEVAASPHGA